MENLLSIFSCSTKHLLFVSFTTLKRTAQVFNRGFFGLYDFSDQYVKLGADQTLKTIFNMRFLQILSKILTLSTSGGLSATKRYWAGNYTIIKEANAPYLTFGSITMKVGKRAVAKCSAPTTRSLTKYEVIALPYLMIVQGAFLNSSILFSVS